MMVYVNEETIQITKTEYIYSFPGTLIPYNSRQRYTFVWQTDSQGAPCNQLYIFGMKWLM